MFFSGRPVITSNNVVGFRAPQSNIYRALANAGPNYWGINELSIGTVKWFNSVKGFGFIQPEDGSKDVFVHISAVERSNLANLGEGQRVEYDIERGQQGKSSAVNLRSA